ncbi:methyltransferase domain-containing protein [Sulfitobacter sp. F26169L]|uniref:class I SAM-dependent DNA methyltransferase n=1 Tax=Sulfitobacter sp. F26169L TaxID=2996015 RepID=UPI002260AC97|nr:methyltransferase domain-containing protein [Sulfitobacter sp. F26169L]MCX7565348.1 methyltransferase domain-containing protein [Sulfitobacter sp. F26169L]
MKTPFLDKAYAERDTGSTREHYDKWSDSYEAEVGTLGYATPARCAQALAEFAPDKSLPLLDFGCGTGLAGLAFKLAGFDTIDGVDLSAEMLAQAREKDIYRKLTQIDPDAPLEGEYPLIGGVGVIGAGAAPISTLNTLLHALPSNGLLVFSFNDHTLEDPASTACLNEWLDCGAARLLFSEHGEHLPGKDLGATVYVIEKA